MNVKEPLQISIVIPVLNESLHIVRLLNHISKNSHPKNIKEIIVVDGGSTDNTMTLAKKLNATVVECKKGRARQMNFGANVSTGQVLYFLHADTYPPKKFDHLILRAIENDHKSGCFRMRFDTRHPILRFFAWLSRINHSLCRGGDQSLFISKEVFDKNNGFNEAYMIYEDSEFIRRLYKNTSFKVLPEKVITSARKYRQKGWFRVQFYFAVIHLKNYLGAGPNELYNYYSKKLLA